MPEHNTTKYDGGVLHIGLETGGAPAIFLTFELTKQAAAALRFELDQVQHKAMPGEIKATLVKAINAVSDFRRPVSQFEHREFTDHGAGDQVTEDLSQAADTVVDEAEGAGDGRKRKGKHAAA